MILSIHRYFKAKKRLKETNKTIEAMGGEDASSPILLAQRDMNINETTYYWYRTIAEVIYILIFVAVCGIIYGVTDENYLRTLWSGILSWYAQTLAWGQLQTKNIVLSIYESMSR